MKFQTTFESPGLSYNFSLGLGVIPEESKKPLNAERLEIFLSLQVDNPIFKSLFLKKSKKFIYLNQLTGKYETILISETKDIKREEIVWGGPATEELEKAFFVTEV